jgi:hypothetical protein
MNLAGLSGAPVDLHSWCILSVNQTENKQRPFLGPISGFSNYNPNLDDAGSTPGTFLLK